ncbi:MAG: helix-hairpin-helix domain-containing protein, partial [Bacteroidota bacterium]|nr:helix-hairpin-helix domain-containing protein [Bacteroidota bacterium]
MKVAGVVLTLWLYAIVACAQHTPEIDLDQLTDDLLAGPGNDMDYEDAYERLAQILSSPHDLNRVTAEELLQLNVLTDQQVEDLLAYRREYGPLIDIHELQAIPGFTPTTISTLLPFVTLVDPATRIDRSLVRRIFSPGNSYLVMRYERTLEAKKGFKAISGNAAAYAGSPDKLYFRARSSLPGDFSLGLTGEKDPGEKIRFDGSGHQAGFDFTSYHLQLRNKGRLKN